VQCTGPGPHAGETGCAANSNSDVKARQGRRGYSPCPYRAARVKYLAFRKLDGRGNINRMAATHGAAGRRSAVRIRARAFKTCEGGIHRHELAHQCRHPVRGGIVRSLIAVPKRD